MHFSTLGPFGVCDTRLIASTLERATVSGQFKCTPFALNLVREAADRSSAKVLKLGRRVCSRVIKCLDLLSLSNAGRTLCTAPFHCHQPGAALLNPM